VNGPLRVEDDDSRPQRMTADPGGYFDRARMRAEREIASQDRKPATLGPGVVEMSLRGAEEDVERLVEAMRAAGVKVWRVNDVGLRGGRGAGYSYFSLEVPQGG
jgi:hypothetical protein